jgi:8-oxo-dGTP diphosphatase
LKNTNIFNAKQQDNKMEERPKVGVGVFVKKDGKFLFLKRKGAHGEGDWSFPGGHLEFGETPEECALREIEEEVGINVKNLRRVGFTNDIFTKEGKHYITLFIMADYDSGNAIIKEPQKCDKLEWFGWDDLPENLFLPIANLKKEGFDPFK